MRQIRATTTLIPLLGTITLLGGNVLGSRLRVGAGIKYTFGGN